MHTCKQDTYVTMAAVQRFAESIDTDHLGRTLIPIVLTTSPVVFAEVTASCFLSIRPGAKCSSVLSIIKIFLITLE